MPASQLFRISIFAVRRTAPIAFTVAIVVLLIVNILITFDIINRSGRQKKKVVMIDNDYSREHNPCVNNCKTGTELFKEHVPKVVEAVTKATGEIIKAKDSKITATVSDQTNKNHYNLPRECQVLKIQGKFTASKHGRDEKIACQPHIPSAETCKFARKIFKFNEKLLDCKDAKSSTFCEYHVGHKIRCDFPNFCHVIKLDVVDTTTGDYKTLASYGRREDAVNAAPGILRKLEDSSFKFAFILCIQRNGSLRSQQLFSAKLPPRPDRGQTRKTQRNVNVNIVLLDSLSRPHFYRSLPLLIKEFNRINTDVYSGAEVLDFTSFQSVHGHSAENAHALFTGSLFLKEMTDTQVERANVGIGELLGKFKNAGYRTMYQDDLCWLSRWGMRLELGNPSTWKKFLESIKAAHIDDTGLTMSSCKILGGLGYRNPFQGVKYDQICFNGDFQHNYLLNYAINWHNDSQQPSFSYTALNVPHDGYGLRTQTLNKGLINHVRESLLGGNTITIMLADHGNTYTSFVRQTVEGRFEMYHPSFFMVVPDSVSKILGEKTMNSLRANQKRLFTMLDLNAGLQAIVNFAMNREMPNERGIFGLIPGKRTCDDLPLKLPNLCVCKGWDNAARNDSLHLSILEFAVGTLNNRITSQIQSSVFGDKNQGPGSDISGVKNRRCHHLVPLYFKNIRERSSKNALITSFDFVVSAGQGVANVDDTFHVEVKTLIGPKVLDNYLELLSFDRISPYGPYRKCADQGVDIRLCVCSIGNIANAKNGISYVGNMSVKALFNYMPNLNGLPSRNVLFNRKNDKCVYLIARNYHSYTEKGQVDKDRIHTAVLEAMNICPVAAFTLNVKINTYLMKISGEKTFNAILPGNSLKFLCMLATKSPSWTSNFRFQYHVSPI